MHVAAVNHAEPQPRGPSAAAAHQPQRAAGIVGLWFALCFQNALLWTPPVVFGAAFVPSTWWREPQLVRFLIFLVYVAAIKNAVIVLKMTTAIPTNALLRGLFFINLAIAVASMWV